MSAQTTPDVYVDASDLTFSLGSEGTVHIVLADGRIIAEGSVEAFGGDLVVGPELFRVPGDGVPDD